MHTYNIHIAIGDNWISNYNLLSDHEKGIGDVVQQYKYQYQVLYTPLQHLCYLAPGTFSMGFCPFNATTPVSFKLPSTSLMKVCERKLLETLEKTSQSTALPRTIEVESRSRLQIFRTTLVSINVDRTVALQIELLIK
jgi:hypothetical protein